MTVFLKMFEPLFTWTSQNTPKKQPGKMLHNPWSKCLNHVNRLVLSNSTSLSSPTGSLSSPTNVSSDGIPSSNASSLVASASTSSSFSSDEDIEEDFEDFNNAKYLDYLPSEDRVENTPFSLHFLGFCFFLILIIFNLEFYVPIRGNSTFFIFYGKSWPQRYFIFEDERKRKLISFNSEFVSYFL